MHSSSKAPPKAGYRCKICGKEGGQEDSHWFQLCPYRGQQSDSSTYIPPKKGYVCKYCNKPGGEKDSHWFQQCPHYRKNHHSRHSRNNNNVHIGGGGMPLMSPLTPQFSNGLYPGMTMPHPTGAIFPQHGTAIAANGMLYHYPFPPGAMNGQVYYIPQPGGVAAFPGDEGTETFSSHEAALFYSQQMYSQQMMNGTGYVDPNFSSSTTTEGDMPAENENLTEDSKPHDTKMENGELEGSLKKLEELQVGDMESNKLDEEERNTNDDVHEPGNNSKKENETNLQGES